MKVIIKFQDSLNQLIAKSERLSNRQRYLLNFCTALIEGKNDKIYRNFKYEYDLAPQHLESNSTSMVVLMQYINKPEDVEDVFNEIPMKDMSIENCVHCAYRYYMMGFAHNELGQFDKTIKLLEPIAPLLEDRDINTTLMRAYINSGKTDVLEAFMTKLELLSSPADIANINLQLGTDFLLVNDSISANTYFNKVIRSKDAYPSVKAEAYYYKGDYNKAENEFKKLLAEAPNSMLSISKLAVCYAKNGKKESATTLINSLENLREAYQYGSIDYCYAQYYAAINDEEKAMAFLTQSIADGNLYKPTVFQNDVHFQKYKNLPEFQRILKFWQN